MVDHLDLLRRNVLFLYDRARMISIVQMIFFVWSFEISEGILRNQKITISLDSFSNQRFNIFGPI